MVQTALQIVIYATFQSNFNPRFLRKKIIMTKQKFETTILTSGKTATGIRVPEDIVEKLDAGKKPPVKITINNNYTYRSTVAVMNGAFMVGVSSDVREKAGVQGGDKIIVHIELDTEPREVTIPPDFKKALDKNATAKKSYDSLSYSRRKNYVYLIEQAKTEETRQKRIDKAIAELSVGKT
jgi:hypothetical protein